MAERAGLPFVFGLYGIEPLPDTVQLLRDSGACGVLLLRRNIESGEQVRALLRSLEEAVGHPLLAAVEQEGGMASLFPRDVTPFPGNLALGRTETPSLAYEVGKGMARELRPFGIHVDLAPVLDADESLTLRAFGENPELCAVMGTEMIRGMQEVGLSAGAKYFPGRGKGGHATEHLMPFRAAIEKGVDVVVPSSSACPTLDGKPAVFSRRIVHDLLRIECGFRGIAWSPDLASLPDRPAEEAAVEAARAGNDILVVAHHTEVMRRAFEAYRTARDAGRLDPTHLEESQARIESLVRKHAETWTPAGADDDSDPRALSEIIAGASVRVEKDPQKLVPIPRGRRVGILFPRLTDVGDRIVIDDDLRHGMELLRSWVQEVSKSVDVLEIPIEPKADLFAMTLEWCCSLEIVIVFAFDATTHAGHRRVIQEVQRQCPRVVLVPIRNPEDRALADAKSTIVQAYGFRIPQLAAATDVIFRGAGG